MGIPPVLVPVFTPARGDVRYRGAWGGRGSAKSRTFARMAAVFGYREPLRILCVRDLQNSIKESFYAEIKAAIESEPWLKAFYDVGENFIRGKNGTEFLFRGLRTNMSAIKSTADIDICIIEEAEDVGEGSYIELIPTVRADLSEIWVIWNPRDEDSPTDKRFRQNPPPNSVIVECNHRDNPWFPAVLEQERRHDQNTLPQELYDHIWEGAYLRNSESSVLRDCWRLDVVADLTGFEGPYYGADWGFSSDPTALIKFWVNDKHGQLYIERERFGYHVETVDLPEFFKAMPGCTQNTVIRADNARPENISHLQNHGFPKTVGAPKWPGSIEDGISWLRGFDIIINPECKNIADEARKWSFKVDKHTKDVLPVLIDKHNHGWDAVRYGAAPMIRKQGGNVLFEHIPPAMDPIHRYHELNRQWVTSQSGELKVWQEPSRAYVVGATYRLSGAGVASIQVIDHISGEQVAALTLNDPTIPEFTRLIESLCRRYNQAWAVVDTSGPGAACVTLLLKTYKKIFSEIPPEAKTGIASKTRSFGFNGTKHMGALVERLALDASGLRDRTTIDELPSFIKDDDGVITVPDGFGYERVMAYCVAKYCAETLPRPRSSTVANGFGGQPGTRTASNNKQNAWKRGVI